jgi:3-hydroxyisobutyrate dehydrogenase-like beta-hydroxyacid dehydrogenase
MPDTVRAGAIAVIGLGDLGRACGLRLHELELAPLGIEPDPERRGAWEREAGLTGAAGLDAVGAGHVDRVFVCVRTTDQAATVLAGLRARRGGVRRTAYVITTLEPAFARGLGEHAGDGLRVIELPVSGGRDGARRGELTVLIGGDQAQEEDRAFLEATLAARSFAFPRYGDATLAKLVNNVLAGYNALAFARCLELAAGAGLDARRCADVIGAASGASWMADHFAGLVDDLLGKDAGLLAGELGGLPAIDLADPDELVATLRRARRLLT